MPDPETEAELARLRDAYGQLEGELEAARAAAAQPDPQLQAELDRLQAEGVELRTALAEAGRSAGRSAEAAAELQAATVQRDALEARLAEVGDSLAAKERELATQSESIAALEAETAASRETNEAELVRVESELQEVRASLAERDAELAEARRAAERRSRLPHRSRYRACSRSSTGCAPRWPAPRTASRAPRRRPSTTGRRSASATTSSPRRASSAGVPASGRPRSRRSSRICSRRLTDTEQRLVAATLDLARIEAEEQHVRTEAGRVGGLAAELATLRDELDRKDVELAAATLLTEHANERTGELETDVAELRRELTDRDSRLAQATAEAAWLEQELEAKIAAEAVDEELPPALRAERRRVQPARSRRHSPRRRRVRRARRRPLRGRQAGAVAAAGRPQSLRVSRPRLNL